MQTQIDFITSSPINKKKLSGQNQRLFEYLEKGNTIHCFSDAVRVLRIGYLNSRISDLINKHMVKIYKRGKKVCDKYGELTDVKEYSLKPFENN